MNKAQFCREFCQLLQKTDQHKDLEDLIYQIDDKGEELVMPVWSTTGLTYNGKPVNVTADSETAMIKDILKGIE